MSTNFDILEYETNLNNIPNNTEKKRCQEPELFELQVPKENMVDEILLSKNKEQKLQAKLTKLDQWIVKKVFDETDNQGQD